MLYIGYIKFKTNFITIVNLVIKLSELILLSSVLQSNYFVNQKIKILLLGVGTRNIIDTTVSNSDATYWRHENLSYIL